MTFKTFYPTVRGALLSLQNFICTTQSEPPLSMQYYWTPLRGRYCLVRAEIKANNLLGSKKILDKISREMAHFQGHLLANKCCPFSARSLRGGRSFSALLRCGARARAREACARARTLEQFCGYICRFHREKEDHFHCGVNLI